MESLSRLAPELADLPNPLVNDSPPGLPSTTGVSLLDPGRTAPHVEGPGDSTLSPTDRASFAVSQYIKSQQQSIKDWQKDPLNRAAKELIPEEMGADEAGQASRYTDNGQSYLRGRNNEAVAAANQGFWSRTWNDTKGFGGNMLGSIIAAPLAIPQLIKGAASLLRGEGLDQAGNYLRGEEGSYLNDINKWQDGVNEGAVNFQSDWAAQNKWKNMIPIYGGEGGTDFGSLVRSGGFVIGGIATSLAETALGTALAPVTGGGSLGLVAADVAGKLARAFKSLSTIGKSLDVLSDAVKLDRQAEGALRGVNTLNKLGKLWTGFDTPLGSLSTRSAIHGFLLANGEASLEGFSAEKETYRQLVDEYKQANGQAPEEAELAKIKQASQQAGNTTFLLNHAVLGITNKFQIDNILKNFNGAKAVFGNLEDDLYRVERKAGTGVFEAVANKSKPITFGSNDKWYQKGLGTVATAGQKVGTGGVLALSEGVEESLQKAIQDGSQDYYKYQYNLGSKPDLSYALTAAGKGLQSAFGTSEGWTEFLGGVLIGGLFGGGSRGITNYLNKPKVKAQFDEYARQMNITTEALQGAVIEQLNSSVLGTSLVDKTGQVNGSLTSSRVQAVAAKQQDQLIFQNQKATGQFAFLEPFVKQGAGDVLREQFATFRKDIQEDPTNFADSFGLDSNLSKEQLTDSVEQLEQKLKQLEDSHSKFKGLYSNPYQQDIIRAQKQGNIEPELLDNYQTWNGYYDELLHNDFLRSQYGERIQKLNNKTSLLGDLPYTSKPGWDSHEATLKDRLAQLDEEVKLAKQDARAGIAEGSPVTPVLEQIEKDLYAQQQNERDQLTRRLSIADGVKQSNFTDYDKLLGAIKQDLLEDNNPAVTTATTHDELKEYLQASFDSKELVKSIDKLADKFNQLTSRKGFESYREEKGDYVLRQIDREEKEKQKSRQELRTKILSQFSSLSDAQFHLGDVDTYVDQYQDSFVTDPDVTLDTINTDITDKKQRLADQKQQREDNIQGLIDLVSGSLTDRAKAAGFDLDGKYLRKLAEDTYTASPDTDLLDLLPAIEAQYEARIPKPKPIANSATTPAVTPEVTPAPLASVVTPSLPATDTPAANDATVPLTTVLEPVVNAEPTAPTITQDEGVLEGKLFNSGMTVVKQRSDGSGNKWVPKYYKWYKNGKDFDDPANRENWEKVVAGRKAIMDQLNRKRNPAKLSDLVDWDIIQMDGADQQLASLGMDSGLARATVGRYLVARPKGEPDGAGLFVLPLENSLYVSQTVQTALFSKTTPLNEVEQNKLIDLIGDTQLKAQQAGTGRTTVLLTDLLKIGGSKTFDWLKSKGYLNVSDQFVPFMEKVKSYEQALHRLTNLLQTDTVDQFQAERLNLLELKLLVSEPFPAKTDISFGIDELAFNEYVPGKKLMVNMKRAADGSISVKLVEQRDDTSVVSKREFDQLKASGKIDELQDPKRWENRFAGNYLLVTDHNETPYRFKVVNDSGTSLLLDKIKNKQSFTGGADGFNIEITSGGNRVTGVELFGANLNKGELKLVYQQEGQTYYSSSLDTAKIAIDLASDPELGEQTLQQELDRVLNTFSGKDGAKQIITPDITFDSIDLQQGDTNRYNRKVRVQSSAVFKRVDVNWNMAPVIETPGDQIVIPEPSVTLPQATAFTNTNTEQDMNTDTQNVIPELEPLIAMRASPELIHAVQARLAQTPSKIVDFTNLDHDMKSVISQLDYTDEDQVDALVNAITTVQQGTSSLARTAVPTTRLTPQQLDSQVTELMKKCL